MQKLVIFFVLAFLSQGCVILLPLVDLDKSAELSDRVDNSASVCPFKAASSSEEVTAPQKLASVPKTRRAMSKRQLVKILVEQLGSDSDDVVRTHAATDLGMQSVSSNTVLTALSRAARFDSSKWVRRASVKSLEKVGGHKAIPVLKLALKDKNPWVVHSAKKALSRLILSRARLNS